MWGLINILDKSINVDIKVNDIMSTPVVTVHIKETINKIAALMRSRKIGSLVVSDSNSNPIGVITERDIVKRIVSKNLKPSEVTAEEIMSKPLRTIHPDATITEAAKTMRNLGIRRLVVFKDSKLVGIVSSDDIARITPELITLISEKSSMGLPNAVPEKTRMAGQCEKCDNWFDDLNDQEGSFLCEECLEET